MEVLNITLLPDIGSLPVLETMLLIYGSGVMIGLAVKKGLTAILLGFAGYTIASYVGFTFLPAFPLSSIKTMLYSYVTAINLSQLVLTTSLLVFGAGIVTGLLILRK